MLELKVYIVDRKNKINQEKVPPVGNSNCLQDWQIQDPLWWPILII